MLALATRPGRRGSGRNGGLLVGGKRHARNRWEGLCRPLGDPAAGLAYGPDGEPRMIVAVMVDEPNNGTYYGGTVAAPVFSAVVQQSCVSMGVAPDIGRTAPNRRRPGGGILLVSSPHLSVCPAPGLAARPRPPRGKLATRQPPREPGRYFLSPGPVAEPTAAPSSPSGLGARCCRRAWSEHDGSAAFSLADARWPATAA